MIATTPHERTHVGTLHGQIAMIQNPDVFPARYEVWMHRTDWGEWRRLIATDDLTEAQAAFTQGLTQL
jgi:hypothetical protein